MKGSILFAIASILTLSSTVNAALKCVGNADCGTNHGDFCIKTGTGAWACPTAAQNGCGDTPGTATAYAENKFCCKAANIDAPPTSTECLTTDVRWCGPTGGTQKSCPYSYCFRDKKADGNGKTDCPSADTKNDACKDITEDQERLIDSTKFCCKKTDCPGTSTTRLTTPASNTPSNKDSGASGMQQNMAGLLTTTTAALFLALFNP